MSSEVFSCTEANFGGVVTAIFCRLEFAENNFFLVSAFGGSPMLDLHRVCIVHSLQQQLNPRSKADEELQTRVCLTVRNL